MQEASSLFEECIPTAFSYGFFYPFPSEELEEETFGVAGGKHHLGGGGWVW